MLLVHGLVYLSDTQLGAIPTTIFKVLPQHAMPYLLCPCNKTN